MILTDTQFYKLYGSFEYLITEMEIKLLEARKKALKGNFNDAEDKIEILKSLRNAFHQIWHNQFMVDNSQIKVIQERQKLLSKIITLEMENKSLKENIK
jgi:hypothetical protein